MSSRTPSEPQGPCLPAGPPALRLEEGGCVRMHLNGELYRRRRGACQPIPRRPIRHALLSARGSPERLPTCRLAAAGFSCVAIPGLRERLGRPPTSGRAGRKGQARSKSPCATLGHARPNRPWPRHPGSAGPARRPDPAPQPMGGGLAEPAPRSAARRLLECPRLRDPPAARRFAPGYPACLATASAAAFAASASPRYRDETLCIASSSS